MTPRIRSANPLPAPPPAMESPAALYCPICTHTVQGTVVMQGRTVRTKPGQKCPRCTAPLDAAPVIRLDRAA